MKIVLIALIAMTFAFQNIAFAGGGRNAACKADLEKFCKDIEKGKGRVGKCLADHKSELSQECSEHMKARKEHTKEVATACKNDKEKFCQGVAVGKGGIRGCLKTHEAELSDACKQAIATK